MKWLTGVRKGKEQGWGCGGGMGGGVSCVAASGPRIIGSYRGISANHVKSGRPLCAPRTSHRSKFPSPKLMTNTNAILSASPPSYSHSLLSPITLSAHGPSGRAKLKFYLFHFVFITRYLCSRGWRAWKPIVPVNSSVILIYVVAFFFLIRVDGLFSYFTN